MSADVTMMEFFSDDPEEMPQNEHRSVQIISENSTEKVNYVASNYEINKMYMIMGLLHVDMSELTNLPMLNQLVNWFLTCLFLTAKPYLGNTKLCVIHVRGVKDLGTPDIVEYFKNYRPSSVDWLNQMQCMYNCS